MVVYLSYVFIYGIPVFICFYPTEILSVELFLRAKIIMLKNSVAIVGEWYIWKELYALYAIICWTEDARYKCYWIIC